MKKWLVPFLSPFISIAAYILIYELAHWANGDGTGYGGVVYGLIGMIIYGVIVIPATCILYSKLCLSGQKLRFLFTLYQSFLITLPYFSVCLLLNGGLVYMGYSLILFTWCELWSLLGLIKFKRKDRKQVDN